MIIRQDISTLKKRNVKKQLKINATQSFTTYLPGLCNNKIKKSFFPKNMLNTQRHLPTDDDKDRAERIRKIIEALIEANGKFPVIVEGKKDADALLKLGLTGKILTLHNGRNLYDFSEDILDKFVNVIILLDWDAKGENLYRSLTENLTGLWERFSDFREIIKVLCQKDIKDIESIPTLLSRLEGQCPVGK